MPRYFYTLFILPIIFILSCNKEKEVTNSLKTLQAENALSVAKKIPIVVGAGNKSMTVLNANTGNTIWYNDYLAENEKNRFLTQSPLFLDSVAINFFGNIIICTRIANNSKKWETHIGSFSKNWPNYHTSYPCVTDNLVIFSFIDNHSPTKTGVYALDIETGKVVWSNETLWTNPDTQPTAANNSLIINGTHNLYSLNLKNGNILWKVNGSGYVYNPCIQNDRVYYTLENYGYPDSLFSRNLTDGSLYWSRQIPDITPIENHGAPLPVGEHLYLNVTEGILDINPSNGKTIWEFSARNRYGFYPAYFSDGKIFTYTTNDMYLFALDAFSGKKLWEHYVGSQNSYNNFEGPVKMQDKVYVRYNGDFVNAYNSVDGALLWSTRCNNRQLVNPSFAPSYVDETGNMVYLTISGMH